MIQSAIVNVESKLNRFENFVTDYAKENSFATHWGLAKISVGLVQTIAAVAITALSPLADLYALDLYLTRYSVQHIAHGIANIIVGIFQAIPFATTIKESIFESSPPQHYFAVPGDTKGYWFYDIHAGKKFPYEALRTHDLNYGRNRTDVDLILLENNHWRVSPDDSSICLRGNPVGSVLQDVKDENPRAGFSEVKRLFKERLDKQHAEWTPQPTSQQTIFQGEYPHPHN